jgi:formylglycine-generating enzyme required for sulfatase activity
MHGGIAEWVADCWRANYAGAPADGSARADGSGSSGGRCDHHVLRGGSWTSDPGDLRASNRMQYETGVRYPANGLRVARDVE